MFEGVIEAQIWILKRWKYHEWWALFGTPNFTYVYLDVPDLDEWNMYRTPLCFSTIFPLVPCHCFLKSVHLKPGRLQDKWLKWSKNCTVPSADECHGLREIQQDTLYFISDQTYYVFFLALFRPSKDGHFTINRCFSFWFFLRFPFNFGLRSCCGHSWKALLKLAKCEGNATQRNVMQRNAT